MNLLKSLVADMQTRLEKINSHKFLLFSLLATGFIMLYANFLSDETRTLITNLLYVPVPGAMVILSIILSTRFRTSGKHGKAWILFALLAVLWFTAEQIWIVYELIYHIDPWPSVADFFYIAGYPFLFAFSIFYLLPLRKAISRKLIIATSLVSIALFIPTIILVYENSSSENNFEIVLASSYPILDAIILCPALIGISLFFKGEANILWTVICAAIILNVVADTGFLMLTIDDSYYTGHPVDLLFLWQYLLFSFGVHHHIRIFKSHIKDPYENIDELI